MKTALTALAASFVWGTAFAFQRMAAGHIGAITFNFYRSVLAALSLGVLLFVSNRRKKPEERKKSDPKKIAIGGSMTDTTHAVTRYTPRISASCSQSKHPSRRIRIRKLS